MEDMISRKAAIDAVENIDCSDGVGISALKCEAVDDGVTAIKALPSAQPEKVDTPTVDTPNCDDTISRQAAIDTLDKHLRTTDVPVSYPGIISALTEWLNELPSAQADMSEYSDKLWKAAYERGKAEAQPDLDEVYAHAETEAEARFHAERKKGRWIPQDHNKTNGMMSTLVYYYPKCSVCGHCANYTNFCPNCGARMEGE